MPTCNFCFKLVPAGRNCHPTNPQLIWFGRALELICFLIHQEDATACPRAGRKGETSLSARPGDAWSELSPAGVLLALQHLLPPPQLGQGGGGGETADLLLLPVAHGVPQWFKHVRVRSDHSASSALCSFCYLKDFFDFK